MLSQDGSPLGRSRTLPGESYLDPAVLDWERAHVFAGWACTGRSQDVPDAGSQLAVAHGTSSVLLTRGADGVLRAFANVCRHRGHELLPCGAGARKKGIVCPYHAWSYRLDGSLLAAPGFREVDGFDPAQLGLVPLPSQEWNGWLFVDGSGRAGPFETHVGALEEVLAPYRPADLTVLATREYDVAANWKVVVESVRSVALFPDLLVSLHPDHLVTHRLAPVAVDRTRVRSDWLVPAAAAGRQRSDPARAQDDWDLANRRGWAACESVQRGLADGTARPRAPDDEAAPAQPSPANAFSSTDSPSSSRWSGITSGGSSRSTLP